MIKPDMTDQEIATILSEESTDFFNNSLFHEVRKGKVTSFNIRSSSSYVSPEGSQVASPETSSSSGDDFPMPIFPTPVAIKE